jgi:hypothetical protein
MNPHPEILERKVLGCDVAFNLMHFPIPVEICSKLIFRLEDVFPVI